MTPDPKAPETIEPQAPDAAEQPQTPEPGPDVAVDAGPEPEASPEPGGAGVPEAPAKARAPEADAPDDDPAKAGATKAGATKHGTTKASATKDGAPDAGAAKFDVAEEAEDHEGKVQRDLEELAAKAEKADEYLELAQRTKADFENYRKRAVRDAAAAQERGVVKLARELLPAVDNLDRALEAATAASFDLGDQSENGVSQLVSGIKLVHADVIAALARVGIEPFSPNGEQFDPQHHEAVAQQPVEGAEPGTIVEVYQRGYRLGDSVLRPARVLVAA